MEVGDKSFGARLRRLRERSGLTQEELAERAGLSSNAIGALERGERRHPYPHTVGVLAAALDLGPDERAMLTADIPSRRARGARRGNLPAEVTSFVGRRELIRQVRSGLTATRLLTLIGPGGVGKTRVALRAAARLQEDMTGGVWLVELAGLSDPRLVLKAVMTSLGMRDQAGGWSVRALARHLGEQRVLLVLDNCEHLLDACAGLVDALLREAPRARILATSRQPLRVAGERVLPVGPLMLPGPDQRFAVERAGRSESVALFVRRAVEATGSFRLTAENRGMVLELCSRLDAMPLAIELAAVRLRTLGLEQILARLNDRFHLLTAGSRAALPRQQTLRATIEWSYELLDETERTALRWLAVFAGTFELEAAQSVLAAGGIARNVVEVLSGLVEKSVVSREGTEALARYRLHETVRDYGWLRLTEAGEEPAAVEAHLRYYLALGRRADKGWFGPQLPGWLDRLELVAGDVRAALQRCLTRPGMVQLGLGLAGSLWFYWVLRAVSEGVHLMDQLLSRPGGDEAARTRVLFARGAVAISQPDLATGMRLLDDAIGRARRAGDDDSLAMSLSCLAVQQALAGDTGSARATAEETTRLARTAGRPSWLCQAALARGIAASYEGDFERARAAYEELAGISRAHQEVWMLSHGYLNMGLGLLSLERGHPQARRELEEALRLKRVLDDRTAIAYALAGIACHAAATGDGEGAARLFGAVEALHREDRTRTQPFLVPYLDEGRRRALDALGRARFEVARQEGQELDRDQAIAVALGV